MKNTSSKIFLKATLVIILATASFCKAISQTPGKVVVAATEQKTNIWVSNFPKNASLLVVDADLNLVTVVSTNDFGATFISIDKAIKTTLIVKTMNSEVIASNKATQTEVAAIDAPVPSKA